MHLRPQTFPLTPDPPPPPLPPSPLSPDQLSAKDWYASEAVWGRGSGPQPASSSVPPGPPPVVIGLALLHPNLSGQMGPALSRLLARSKLGRSILRPLLRTEVGALSDLIIIN